MNYLTASIYGSYWPRLALVVYREQTQDQETDNYYIESHAIDGHGRILEGKPLSAEGIEGMVGVFFDEKRNRSNITGLFPPSLLQFELRAGSDYRMMWHRPAERRVLHFAEGLKIDSGLAWVPPMLYIAGEGSLSVFALADEQRPGPETVLYRAPFHNVNSEGSVCLGSARVKRPNPLTYDSLIAYWEEMFWNSEFTHITGNESPVKGNVNLLWQELITHPRKRFPISELTGADKKLKTYIR